MRLQHHALIAVSLLACSASEDSTRRSNAPTPTTHEVRLGSVAETLLLSGELEAVTSVELAVPRTETWQLTIQWLAEDGERVEPGGRAVEFDNSAFTANLEQQRLLVKQARRDYATQRALQKMTVADKEHAVKTSRLAVQRAELYAGVAKDLLPERDWQERQLALERASAALLSAEADLEAASKAASLDLKVKRIELEKSERAVATAEEGIAALTLTAADGGLALVADHPWEQRKLAAGDTVQPGWTVVSFPDLSRMRLAARLSDVDDGRLAVGMPVTIHFDAFPDRTIGGQVEGITAVAREVGWQSLQRAFDVHVSLEKTDSTWMRPGMSARIEAITSAAKEALIVPRAALRRDDEGAATVELDGGERRVVEIGACSTSDCEVKSGLTAGQTVVVGGDR